jgi:hypothetical protein
MFCIHASILHIILHFILHILHMEYPSANCAYCTYNTTYYAYCFASFFYIFCILKSVAYYAFMHINFHIAGILLYIEHIECDTYFAFNLRFLHIMHTSIVYIVHILHIRDFI